MGGAPTKKKTFSPVLARARFFYQSKRVMILNKRILADLSFHSIFVWNVPSKNTKKQVVRSHFKRGLFYQLKNTRFNNVWGLLEIFMPSPLL